MSIDLDAIQARADAATEGPWEAQDCGHDCCFWVTDPSDRDGQLAGFKTAADASLFAHARTDVPALLAYARDLEARIGRVEALADGWLEKYGPGSHAAEVLGPQKVSIKFAVNEIRAALAASDTP